MQQYIEWVNVFLATPSPLRAVLFALLLSWGGTQVLKRNSKLLRKWLESLDDDSHRIVLRAIAFLLAWVPAFLLWPSPDTTERLLAAGVTAVCAPYVYSIFTTVAFHFWPWLEPKMSARPREQDVAVGGSE